MKKSWKLTWLVFWLLLKKFEDVKPHRPSPPSLIVYCCGFYTNFYMTKEILPEIDVGRFMWTLNIYSDSSSELAREQQSNDWNCSDSEIDVQTEVLINILWHLPKPENFSLPHFPCIHNVFSEKFLNFIVFLVFPSWKFNISGNSFGCKWRQMNRSAETEQKQQNFYS